ncbi:MAG TPA: phage shock protein PspA [Gammaproteobacteria bacterium]|nr:phage shock protein PspA [Gammaproteobacteria bacterium]HIK70536.1 phage shock protein PspA [Pseudomonadales bacterium]
MGIFSRFTDIINANINSILDKAEDPEKMVRLIIQEMEETLVEVRTQSAKLIADKKELGRKSERWSSEIVEWERKAEVAISKEREDLARAALKEKRNCEEASITLESELQQVSDSLEKLSGDVAQLQQKLKDAKLRQKALILRGDTAKSRMGVKRQLHTVNIDEALTKFDRFERRIDDMEGEVEAFELGQRSLSEEIAELERDEQINADLAELKAKMSGLEQAQSE